MAKHLTQDERYYILRRIANLDRIKVIAEDLKVNKSTVYRELKRNKNDAGDYNATLAHKKATLRRRIASRSKAFKAFTQETTQYIYNKLRCKWSPEQISGRMKEDIGKSLSYKTIYSFIRHDKAIGGTLYTLLSRRGKRHQYGRRNCVQIANRLDISQRPAIVDKKSRIGDFEIDTIVSAKNTGYSCLLTMVDRRSKFVFIRKVPNKSAYEMQIAIEEVYQNTIIPFRTITSDNGVEFANHRAISENIACKFYFARPYCSWDRGLNEHTNGLIRKFFPKRTNFDTISDAQIQEVQNLLNYRPRKVLKFKNPNEVISKYLQRVAKNRLRHSKFAVAFHE